MVEVTDGFFEVLGVTPAFGRTFTPTDMPRSAPPVVMLSHAAWTRRFVRIRRSWESPSS